MKKILLALAMLVPAMALAQETPSWIRRNAISPDGKTVAFSYKGDLYTVPATGGTARQITSNAAYESDPVWTRDGRQIVFTSWREESKDIYVTSKDGGAPRRLTTLPGNETLLTVDKDGNVWFTWYDTDLMTAGFDGFPGTQQLYRTNLEGTTRATRTPSASTTPRRSPVTSGSTSLQRQEKSAQKGLSPSFPPLRAKTAIRFLRPTVTLSIS